ncbi:sarcosine oxidase subunit beta, partial [bacterium]|nr:sarcosine oxidase subunit beta [bacterium]
MKVVVIGKGILGLSVAEFLSRSGSTQVQVLSSVTFASASSA